jgi:RNA polymerase sigma-70 factor (ECF subfamily)
MDLEGTLADVAPGLLRYCTGTSGDPAAGEELAQEALTALVSHWRRHGPPESSRAFVFVVARRLVRRWRWRRRLLVPLEQLRNGRHPDPDPETTTGRRRELHHALAAIRVLPDRERQALLLTIGGDLDVAAAANVLGISRSAFKMRVHRARRKLGSRLETNHGKR